MAPEATYPPLDCLKPVAPDIWIVDGPVIRFGPSVRALSFLRLPFPTRMTIMRLRNGDLLVHSPTALAPSLADELVPIGRPRFIVGPNRLHYWWIPQWHAHYPEAEVYLAPELRLQAGGRIDFAAAPLAAAHGYPWDAEIATLPVAGRYMTEVVLFHRASRTLVLTDLIENFETEKVGSRLLRLIVRVGGVRAPDGAMPRDLRLTFPKATLRAAVETMLRWQPERVIIAHGRWFEHDGERALRRAFRWLLT
ncbi:MAG: DUF4336 domain-containing protein [Hyphomicrobiales bacterium]|nr:DUF4336 domain-containing protein [Hyphomicrobiales bacterium]